MSWSRTHARKRYKNLVSELREAIFSDPEIIEYVKHTGDAGDGTIERRLSELRKAALVQPDTSEYVRHTGDAKDEAIELRLLALNSLEQNDLRTARAAVQRLQRAHKGGGYCGLLCSAYVDITQKRYEAAWNTSVDLYLHYPFSPVSMRLMRLVASKVEKNGDYATYLATAKHNGVIARNDHSFDLPESIAAALPKPSTRLPGDYARSDMFKTSVIPTPIDSVAAKVTGLPYKPRKSYAEDEQDRGDETQGPNLR